MRVIPGNILFEAGHIDHIGSTERSDGVVPRLMELL